MNKQHEYFIFVLLIVTVFFVISCKQEMTGTTRIKSPVKEKSTNDISINKDSIITVYYFHTTYRCYSCTKIEALTKEALNNHFNEQIKSGKIIYKAVNIEKTENKHFIQDYQLFTKSVVLVYYMKKKQIKWKRLDKTWNQLRNSDAFTQYIKNEINTMIKE